MVQLPSNPTGPEGPDGAARVLFGAALLLGLVRFAGLGQWSLWIDEALTLADYHHGLDDGQIGNPLGYLAIGWLCDAFAALGGGPPDELLLRLLPALCGWLVIPLTFWAFRPFAGDRVAAAGALLVAVSSWHVYWSQTARFYTMAQLVGLAGAGLLLRGLWAGAPWRTVAGLVVSGTGALFHPSLALVPPALVAAAWAPILARREPSPASRRAARALLFAAVVGGLIALGWALRVWDRYLLNKPEGNPAHFVLTTGFYVTPLLGTGAAIGALFALRRRDAFALVAATVCLGTVFVGVAAAQRVTLSAQYVFAVLPWIAVLACRPLAELRRDGGRGTLLGAGYLALLVLPALTDTGLYFLLRHGDRSRWREAYEYVWNHRGPDDLVMGMGAPVGEYYLDPRSTYLRNPTTVTWIDSWRAAARIPQAWPRYGRRTWYVLREEWLKGWDPADRLAFEAMLRDDARLVRHFSQEVAGRDLSLYVYVRD